MRETLVGRPIKLGGMAYAPTNEQGVVFLFGRLAPRLGFHVELVRTGFPDCHARRRGKSLRLEFEYRASDYERHGHPPSGADVVVCWENDWERRPEKYRPLEIIDLKRYVGALPRVFAVGCKDPKWGHLLDRRTRIDWTVPTNAQVGDLIVMYRTSPASEIRDLWRVVGPFYVDEQWGPQAWLRKLLQLAEPLTRRQLVGDPTTRNLGVVRQNFRGKRDVTDEWPLLYDKIVALNPGSRTSLRDYNPDRL